MWGQPLWLAVWLTLALSGSLWLSLALSGSLWLSEFAYKALAWLTKPLLLILEPSSLNIPQVAFIPDTIMSSSFVSLVVEFLRPESSHRYKDCLDLSGRRVNNMRHSFWVRLLWPKNSETGKIFVSSPSDLEIFHPLIVWETSALSSKTWTVLTKIVGSVFLQAVLVNRFELPGPQLKRYV